MPVLPSPHVIAQHVSLALSEDIGARDWSDPFQHASTTIHSARVIAREAATLCGQAWFNECFRQLSAAVSICWQQNEGDQFEAGSVLCKIDGPSQILLTAERSALNFLQLLSAVATKTRQYVKAVDGTRARIFDTRKTLPGLRLAQKYAVTVGGGHNQRLGLFDGILIKENHIIAAGSLSKAVDQARRSATSHIPLQVEVETLEELDEALAAHVALILLDNMPVATLAEAVRHTAGRACLEASGGIDLNNVRQIADTGVDRISIGQLTKNVRAIDFSMRFL